MSKKDHFLVNGTRDYDAELISRRNYVFETIKGVYSNCCYQPLETPAMEYLDTLTGKYGNEGDQLLYRVLNSGDFLKGISLINDTKYTDIISKISDKGLRYDLTVPMMRYLADNKGKILFPFKRYQIQPVWRADRPQKGRYREFYQCDADVVGNKSLFCEAEMLLMAQEVLLILGITNFTICVNSRKILNSIVEFIEAIDKTTEICISVDKLEKIGKEKVLEELKQKGVSLDSISKLDSFLSFIGTNEDKIKFLQSSIKNTSTGTDGLNELLQVLDYAQLLGIKKDNIKLDLSLVRGLSYYTGVVFEIKANNSSIGSIGSGGRYDNLMSVFGIPEISGVGLSFGVERLLLVMEELGLFKNKEIIYTKVLVTNLHKSHEFFSIDVLKLLRSNSICSDIYPKNDSLKSQLSYANKKSIPFVVIIGDEECQKNVVSLKNMHSGKQNNFSLEQLIYVIKNEINNPSNY